jgi:hypothetical protein
LEITYGVLRIPFVLPMFFLSELWFWWRLRRLVAGDADRAWERLVSLWSDAETFYGGPVGPYMDRAMEDVVIHRFIRAYPDSERVVRTCLTHTNPYVCAYSIQTLCRLMRKRGVVPKRTDFPESLFARNEMIQERSFCFGSDKRLREIVAERIKGAS